MLRGKGGTAARGNASSSLVATRKQTADWIAPSIGEPARCREAGPVWTAEAVLVCALTMLGRSERSFPPIQFVDSVPIDASAVAEAFVRVNDPHIYVVTSSRLFQRLQRASDRCGDLTALRKLASVLVHEEQHVAHNASEADAYAAQLTALTALGSGPGTPLYSDVRRAMRHTLAQRRPEPVRVMVMR